MKRQTLAHLAVLTIAAGASARGPGDCNGNGIPDVQEIADASMHSDASGPMSPFGSGSEQAFDASSLPQAIGSVELLIEASADLGAGNEKVTLYLDGESYGQILDGADDCSSPPDQDTVSIAADAWNALAADGSVVIELVANQHVDAGQCSPVSWISVSLSYEIVPLNDLDRNGELDECQSLRAPNSSVLTQPGLRAQYYSLTAPSSLPDFDALTPFRLAAVPRLDFAESDGNFAGSGLSDNVGAVFEGYITVPAPAFYLFYTTSDDGSRLYIGDRLVVENDGLHPMAERWGVIGLDPGTHALRVEYFDRAGAGGLIASIEGGGLEKQIIPAAMLSHGGGCSGDMTGDGVVGFADILEALASWGPCTQDPCNADVTGDGEVGFDDVLEVLGHWGPCPSDIMVDSIVLSRTLADPGETVTVDVGICNTAEMLMESALVIVNLSDGGGSWFTLVDIEPGCETVAQIEIQAPTIDRECGDPVAYTIEVQIQPIGADANTDNNRAAVGLGVIPRFWDLEFSVSINPDVVFACLPVAWQVKVTNVGNATSPSVRYRTGICPDSGPSDWLPVAWGCPDCETGAIPKHETRTYNHLWPGSGCLILGRQWVKAQVQPGERDCPVGDNFDQHPIWVNP